MHSINDMPGHLIRRLHQISTSVFADKMSEAGQDITPVQFAALTALEGNPGIDQATLAGLIAYDRVTIGGVVDRLEAKGLLQREVSPRDRRARILKLTAEGAALTATLRPAVTALQEDILQGLTAKEKAEFLRLIAKATAAGNMLSRAPLMLPGQG